MHDYYYYFEFGHNDLPLTDSAIQQSNRMLFSQSECKLLLEGKKERKQIILTNVRAYCSRLIDQKITVEENWFTGT